MMAFAKISFALFLLASPLIGAQFESTVEELIGTEAEGSCVADKSCCTISALTSPFTEPGVQNVATSDLTMVAPAYGLDCDCGQNLAKKYITCGYLPLKGSRTFEAAVFSTSVGIALGGFAFYPPEALYPDASVCVVISRCTGTFGFQQTGLPLAAKFPNPVDGPLELELGAVMLSAMSEIEFETTSGLWNGGDSISDPLVVRGQAYIAGSLTATLELGDFECELSLNGQLLFAMDLGKVARGLDTIFKTTLGGGKLDFSASDVPGFQLTASVYISFKIIFTDGFYFKLGNIGGATVTMGVNMNQVYGGLYKGFTNGLYGCMYEQMSIVDFVPFLADAFPSVKWPEYYSDKCFFVSTEGFGFRTTMSISLFGGSFETLFSMDDKESIFTVDLDAWVVTSSIAVVLPYTSAPSFGFTLTCGSKSCVDAMVDGLRSKATSRLEDAALKYFNANLIAAVEVSSEDDVEGLLDELEMGAQGWKKSVKKGTKAVSKGTTDTAKSTADASKKAADDSAAAAKKAADDTAKAAKDAADAAVNVFETADPFVKISNLSASGTLESFKLSLKFEAGITLCGKKYSTSKNVAISWNPDNLFGDLVNAIPMPF